MDDAVVAAIILSQLFFFAKYKFTEYKDSRTARIIIKVQKKKIKKKLL